MKEISASIGKIRIGLIGCGRIATSAHLPAIQKVESLELVAVCDTKLPWAQETARKWGAAMATNDAAEVFNNNEVDAVILCLPHHLHRDAVRQAIEGGKHIFIEKPLGRSPAECDEMIAAAEGAGLILAVGHVMRFSAGLQQLKTSIKEGTIGLPVAIRARRLTRHSAAAAGWWQSSEQCGGLVLPLVGAHIFDTVLWLADSVPKTVYAVGKSVQDAWDGEDEADVIITMESGITASVSLSFNCKLSVNDLTVVGSKDCLQVAEEDFDTDKQDEDPVDRFVLQMQDFAGAVRKEHAPAVDARAGRAVVSIVDAARRSIKSGEVIHL